MNDAQANAENATAPKIFISYSRRNRDVAEKFSEVLRDRGFEVFRDTEDILPTEAWRTRLEQLIADADSIVFLMSPDSVASEVCAWEAEQAASLNKRIAPIVIEETEPAAIPATLARLNYIFCTERDRFQDAVDSIVVALNTDIDWIREHTRLGALAHRWADAGRPGRLLLRGQDVIDAEHWRDGRPDAGPELDDAQAAFIAASRKAVAQRRRNWGIGALAAVIAAAGLATFAYFENLEAERQRAAAAQQERAAEISKAEATEAAERAERQRKLADERRQAALRSDALLIAEEADRLLGRGFAKQAAELAASGLPKPGDERPYLPEVEAALYAALTAGQAINAPRLPRFAKLSAIEISNDGQVVFLASHDQVYGFFNLLTGEPITSPDYSFDYQGMFSRAQDRIAILAGERLDVFDLSTGKPLRSFSEIIDDDRGAIAAIYLSRSSEELFVSRARSRASLSVSAYRIEDGSLAAERKLGEAENSFEIVRAIAESPDSATIYALTSSGRLLGQVGTANRVVAALSSGALPRATFGPAGEFVLLANLKAAQLIRLADGRQELSFTGDTTGTAIFTRDGRRLIIEDPTASLSFGKYISIDLQSMDATAFDCRCHILTEQPATGLLLAATIENKLLLLDAAGDKKNFLPSAGLADMETLATARFHPKRPTVLVGSDKIASIDLGDALTGASSVADCIADREIREAFSDGMDAILLTAGGTGSGALCLLEAVEGRWRLKATFAAPMQRTMFKTILPKLPLDAVLERSGRSLALRHYDPRSFGTEDTWEAFTYETPDIRTAFREAPRPILFRSTGLAAGVPVGGDAFGLIDLPSGRTLSKLDTPVRSAAPLGPPDGRQIAVAAGGQLLRLTLTTANDDWTSEVLADFGDETITQIGVSACCIAAAGAAGRIVIVDLQTGAVRTAPPEFASTRAVDISAPMAEATFLNRWRDASGKKFLGPYRLEYKYQRSARSGVLQLTPALDEIRPPGIPADRLQTLLAPFQEAAPKTFDFVALGLKLGRTPHVALTPNGETLAVSDKDGAVHLFDLKTDAPAKRLTLGAGELGALAFGQVGRWLIGASESGDVIRAVSLDGSKRMELLDPPVVAERLLLNTENDALVIKGCCLEDNFEPAFVFGDLTSKTWSAPRSAAATRQISDIRISNDASTILLQWAGFQATAFSAADWRPVAEFPPLAARPDAGRAYYGSDLSALALTFNFLDDASPQIVLATPLAPEVDGCSTNARKHLDLTDGIAGLASIAIGPVNKRAIVGRDNGRFHIVDLACGDLVGHGTIDEPIKAVLTTNGGKGFSIVGESGRVLNFPLAQDHLQLLDLAKTANARPQ